MHLIKISYHNTIKNEIMHIQTSQNKKLTDLLFQICEFFMSKLLFVIIIVIHCLICSIGSIAISVKFFSKITYQCVTLRKFVFKIPQYLVAGRFKTISLLHICPTLTLLIQTHLDVFFIILIVCLNIVLYTQRIEC